MRINPCDILLLFKFDISDFLKIQAGGRSKRETTTKIMKEASYRLPMLNQYVAAQIIRFNVPIHVMFQAEPKTIVKVLYEYEASAPGELSVKEDEILRVYDEEDDWLLVQSDKEEARIGFVPGNYVEEVRV